MILLDGKKIKANISTILKKEIESFGLANKNVPKLIILQIGNNEVSTIYINQKRAFAEQIGAVAELVKLDQDVSEEDVVAKVLECNADMSVHGIILQLPIPKHINQAKVLNTIAPQKDVDGLGALNIAKLVRNDSTGIIPATARGVVTLLQEYGVQVHSKHIVIVGRSVLVGKTLSLLLTNLEATITLCHSKTINLADITRKADILISAVGKPGIINGTHVHEKQFVIDVGISRNEQGTISGDVILDNVLVAGISPVPGGVGQMTVASLFNNLIDTYKIQNGF